jgi:RHS repeat-associated protein
VAYTFDYGNRLREVAGQENYFYDAYGRRVQATASANGQSILSMYTRDGRLIYQDDQRASAKHDYLYLGRQLVEVVDHGYGGGNAMRYQHADAQGSIVAQTNATPGIIERTAYSSWGAPLNHDNDDEPGYTGQLQDSLTGLTYMQQRYYDPEAGRFLSADPVQTDDKGGNFNRYWYANDNPYRYTDPDGRESGAGYATGEYTTGINQPALDQENSAVAGYVANVLDAVDSTLAGLPPDFGGPEFHMAAAPLVGALREAAAGAKVATKAERLAENVKQGAAAEKAVAAKLGDQVAGTHVTLESSTGQRSVADIVTKDQNVVEVKSGGARLSSGQKAVQADINAGRPVTPRGQNAANAGLKPGQPTTMKCYKVDQC